MCSCFLALVLPAVEKSRKEEMAALSFAFAMSNSTDEPCGSIGIAESGRNSQLR